MFSCRTYCMKSLNIFNTVVSSNIFRKTTWNRKYKAPFGKKKTSQSANTYLLRHIFRHIMFKLKSKSNHITAFSTLIMWRTLQILWNDSFYHQNSIHLALIHKKNNLQLLTTWSCYSSYSQWQRYPCQYSRAFSLKAAACCNKNNTLREKSQYSKAWTKRLDDELKVSLTPCEAEEEL